ncbi:MAG: FAD-dependent oxidoreductase [Pseudomonadota bacterium]
MKTLRFAHAAASEHTDFAIVGAGISGLYSALRLLEKHPNASFTLIERLNRTGGRLDTDLIEIRPGEIVREEEGGMRFNYDMTELMRLIRKLNLCDQIVDFPMASSVEVQGEKINTNRFDLRDCNFLAADGSKPDPTIWAEIYNLKDEERGKSPVEIVTNAYHAVLIDNGWPIPTHQTPDDWTKFRNEAKWDGVAMNQWQMWGLLRKMGHSEECIQMLSESIGFAGPFKAPINAGDAFQILADFPKDPSYHTFKEGFSTLPNAVIKALPDNVKVVLSTNVDSVSKTKDQFELALTQAPDGFNSYAHVHGGVSKSLTADTLIVATASQSMVRLFQSSPALNQAPDAQTLWNHLRAVRPMKLMKINLYFDRPWWQNGDLVEPPVEYGPNFTSLPINAVYPFYALEDPANARSVMASNAGNALLAAEQIPNEASALTIYCDFDNTNFWAGLQSVGPKFDSPLQRQHSKPPQTLFPASVKVVKEAKKQLEKLFSISAVPEPLLTSYRLWDGEDDFEFAYHQYRVGVDDRVVRDYLAKPFNGVHFCNEAISDMQGWVNGSLRSCDAMLAAFGVEPLDGPVCEQAQAAAASTKQATAPRRLGGLWGN